MLNQQPLPLLPLPTLQTGLVDAVIAANLTDALGPDFVGTGER